MQARQYAEAFRKATEGKDDATLSLLCERLTALLEARGHRALLPRIVNELLKLERERKASEVLVRVAHASASEKYRERIARDVETLAGSVSPERVEVDSSLIGGYEVRAHGRRIDRTYKRAVLSLHTALISSS